MNRQKKPFKFYLLIFLLSSVIIAVYSIFMILFKDTEISDIYTLWFMPLLFTLFYYGSDKLMLKIGNKRKKVDYEAKFLDSISEIMRNSNAFLIEEYRKLQLNQKFQDDLKRAYHIFENGEDEVFTIEKLERKYHKDSIEKRAMKYVTDYLKENKKNPEIN